MTVGDTIARAIRMTGARGLGQSVSADETAEALAVFQNMLISLPRTILTDVLITANYTAGENERITMSGGAFTVTKPSTVTDTKTGATRAPRNGAIIEIADATTPQRWIYITELAGWQQVHSLTLTSVQPFGPEHEEGLAAMLAMRLYPTLQQDQSRQPSALTVSQASMGRAAIRQKFRQLTQVTTDPLLLNRFQRNGANTLL